MCTYSTVHCTITVIKCIENLPHFKVFIKHNSLLWSITQTHHLNSLKEMEHLWYRFWWSGIQFIIGVGVDYGGYCNELTYVTVCDDIAKWEYILTLECPVRYMCGQSAGTAPHHRGAFHRTFTQNIYHIDASLAEIY